MKVILFASAMLAAYGNAMSLEERPFASSAQSAASEPEKQALFSFAQTSQLPGQVNEKELIKRAAKAMDKDDKKKMGADKFNQYQRIRKIL